MSEKILVRIILPSKVMLETEASMVNIPGTDGEFGVLAGHVKLVSNIDIGVITLFSGEEKTRCFVCGGVAQVTGSELNIVTEFAADLAKSRKYDVLNDISSLKSDLLDEEPGSVEADIISDKIEKNETLAKFL
ncbi:ATP synthase F1 subunit epsilon [Rickettsiaceae bacterium]|nr:ATP synthase F1 subunit epsilon [Rickettsiaceae bacterium]